MIHHWDDEAVVYDGRTGATHALDSLAYTVFGGLNAGRTEVEVAALVARHLNLPLDDDLRASVAANRRALEVLGLLAAGPPAARPNGGSVERSGGGGAILPKASATFLARVLANPAVVAGFGPEAWDLVLRHARSAGLLGRLAHLLDGQPMPDSVRRGLVSARVLVERHERAVRHEIDLLKGALGATGLPLFLLKGAAYLHAGLSPWRGRLFSDIDILVPHDRLAEAEAVMALNGWVTMRLPAYDDRYYRRWMHQLPPMRHLERGSVIDLHHTIIPATAGIRLDAQALFDGGRPTDDGVVVLMPADMVLHAAAHLFAEGQFGNALRDLDDINQLLRLFGSDPRFWPVLAERAERLDLSRPLFYALRYCRTLFGTPVPPAYDDRGGQPNPLQCRVMDWLFDKAFKPRHASCRDKADGLALWLLYVRSHVLRMPPHLLLPHLLRKAMAGDAAKQ